MSAIVEADSRDEAVIVIDATTYDKPEVEILSKPVTITPNTC
jgi:hypothetical protein